MAPDNKTTTASSGGVGFFGLLAIVFITLKLCGVINWSWWWVLAPLWGSFLFFAAIFFICIVIAVVAAACEQSKAGRRW